MRKVLKRGGDINWRQKVEYRIEWYAVIPVANLKPHSTTDDYDDDYM